jgi:hypothetical protein
MATDLLTPTRKPTTEEFQLRGDDVVGKLKEIVHEGNVRRIVLKNEDEHTIAEFPVTAGIVGFVLAPAWAAVGAIAALAAKLTIIVERRD